VAIICFRRRPRGAEHTIVAATGITVLYTSSTSTYVYMHSEIILKLQIFKDTWQDVVEGDRPLFMGARTGILHGIRKFVFCK
jgi:hypothetical protein